MDSGVTIEPIATAELCRDGAGAYFQGLLEAGDNLVVCEIAAVAG